MKPFLAVTSDYTSEFKALIKKFQRDEVLVGIPEEESSRNVADGEPSSSMNNATLLAINNFGSPQNNIPARPVMENGIRNADEKIAEEFKKAALGAFKKGFRALEIYYNRAGIIASNSVKKAINDQDFEDGPSPSTLAIRRSHGFVGNKSLIVTGQMRNAITYVLRENSLARQVYEASSDG